VRDRRSAAALAIAVLAAIAGVAFFFDLGRAALWDPGEGRYAETVREMLLTRNWIVPTLNFEPYYDKPPGFYWLVASAFAAFGTNAWAARLPSALAALAVIALTTAFAWRRVGQTAAIGAGAVLSTAVLFVALGRSVRMDTALVLAVAGTVFSAYRVWEWQDTGDREPRRPPGTWPIFCFAALGMITKGPVALILPILIFATLAAVTAEYGRVRRLRPRAGGVIALAVASIWYVAAAITAPVYLWTFLWQHNFGRFVDGATGHSQPFWYFLWILPVAFLPWSLFLPGALRRAVHRIRRGHDLELFLVIWVAVVLIFFSCSRAKLATYVLPAFPPLAILVATYLVRVRRAAAATRARALRIPAAVWIAGGAAGVAAIVITIGARYPSLAPRAAITLVLAFFPLYGLRVVRQRRWRAVPALVFAGALATQLLFYRVGAPVVDEFSSLQPAAEAARDLPASAAVFAYKTKGYSFSFYDGRTITRLRSPEAVAAVLGGDQPAALITKTRYLEKIQRQLTQPVCVWWQSASGRVLIANRSRLHTAGLPMLTPQRPLDSARHGIDSPPRC